MLSNKDIKQEWKDDIDINIEQWINLLQDNLIFKEKDIELLQFIYAFEDHMATASQLAELLHMDHHGSLNSQVGRLGKRIANNLDIKAPKQKKGDGYNWFNVPFWGIKTDEGYYWIIRPELKEALEKLSDNNILKLNTEFNLPDELDEKNIKKLNEGAKKQICVNRYERNYIARKRCIEHFGCKCYICGFDFEEVYGEIGKGLIHVHHLKPISEIGEDYEVDPISDLRPVCPNCHSILHKKNPPYLIEEVKNMIKNKK